MPLAYSASNRVLFAESSLSISIPVISSRLVEIRSATTALDYPQLMQEFEERMSESRLGNLLHFFTDAICTSVCGCDRCEELKPLDFTKLISLGGASAPGLGKRVVAIPRSSRAKSCECRSSSRNRYRHSLTTACGGILPVAMWRQNHVSQPTGFANTIQKGISPNASGPVRPHASRGSVEWQAGGSVEQHSSSDRSRAANDGELRSARQCIAYHCAEHSDHRYGRVYPSRSRRQS
jgi:hypothetical protein